MVQQELSHLLHLSAPSETHHTAERAYISRARFDVRIGARFHEGTESSDSMTHGTK
jgi:hypothetical protein